MSNQRFILGKELELSQNIVTDRGSRDRFRNTMLVLKGQEKQRMKMIEQQWTGRNSPMKSNMSHIDAFPLTANLKQSSNQRRSIKSFQQIMKKYSKKTKTEDAGSFGLTNQDSTISSMLP